MNHLTEGHEAECDENGTHAISENINGDIIADRDGEQEELFCRVCDPVDEDIEDGAERKQKCSGRCAILACLQGGKSLNRISRICLPGPGVRLSFKFVVHLLFLSNLLYNVQKNKSQ